MTWEKQNVLPSIIGYVILAFLVLGVFWKFFAGGSAIVCFLCFAD